MTYVPVSQGDKDYIARRMAEGVSEQDAWAMLDEQYAQSEDEGRPDREDDHDEND